jgi:hypothetical protein
MKTIKPINIVDYIEKLYKLESSLESLPPLATDKIAFKIVLDSIGDLISLADQYGATFFEPSPTLPFHWCVINIGDKVSLHLETNRENYKITY